MLHFRSEIRNLETFFVRWNLARGCDLQCDWCLRSKQLHRRAMGKLQHRVFAVSTPGQMSQMGICSNQPCRWPKSCTGVRPFYERLYRTLLEKSTKPKHRFFNKGVIWRKWPADSTNVARCAARWAMGDVSCFASLRLCEGTDWAPIKKYPTSLSSVPRNNRTGFARSKCFLWMKGKCPPWDHFHCRSCHHKMLNFQENHLKNSKNI